eukprot:TRINITY_DN25540_c0_g1_i3.p1 TRINITY_DN25540_c0_g1~~TRINITY_DN25540_c0_g1_i3.p1  ORF type:complete len:311 (+),score=40.32 TRINITY_DN25540_c0_g1_i3:39-935(+)
MAPLCADTDFRPQHLPEKCGDLTCADGLQQGSNDRHDHPPALPGPAPGSESDLLQLKFPPADVARETLAADGFVLGEGLLPHDLCAALNERLQAMLDGTFDTGEVPDKVPTTRQTKRPRVEQFVNAWKGDQLIGSVVQSPAIADWVASVVGWQSGAEVLQDQVFAKPPRAGPVAFHLDNAYMGDGVVTLWITLDDLESKLGPLTYARGSHRWPAPKYEGYQMSLFDKKWRQDVDRAASQCEADVELIEVLLPRGGCSLHYGNTWHGSGRLTPRAWVNDVCVRLLLLECPSPGAGHCTV